MLKHYENLSWKEFEEAKNARELFVLPIGAMEQHGMHLPLGVDTIIPYELMRQRISKRIDIVLMAPVYYGYRSQTVVGGGKKYPGTIRMGSESIIYSVRDIAIEMFRHNVEKLLIINGHLENKYFVIEGIERALAEYQGNPVTKILYAEWNPYVKQETLDKIFGGIFPGWDPEHAAVCETSLLLALKPELVQMDKLPDEYVKHYTKYSVWPATDDMVTKNGALSSARLASTENGYLMLNDISEGLLADIDFEFAKS